MSMRSLFSRFRSNAARFILQPLKGESIAVSLKAAAVPVVFFAFGVLTSQLFFRPLPPLSSRDNTIGAELRAYLEDQATTVAQELAPSPATPAPESDSSEGTVPDTTVRSEELVFTKDDILSDKDERISDLFQVPDRLRSRVGFWFDIYTKYGTDEHVIHHSDFPWIVFKVVKASEAHKPGANKWTNYHRARRLVDAQKSLVVSRLRLLAKGLKPGKLTPLDKELVELLKELPGSRTSVYARAAAAARSQLGQKEYYLAGVTSSSQYITQMEEIFAKYDLPIELTRLPLVESSFNLRAVSKVGASGIWQFMPHTGKTKKLRVDGQFDERNSPIKSTEAAAKLMRENFRILKSWPLAITAYNHGPGGLIKSTQRFGTSDLSSIIEKNTSRSFGFASSNFYCEFLAALHAEKYQEELFGQVPKHAPLAYEEIRLPIRLKAHTIASLAGVTLEELRLYNPDLGRRSIRENLFVPKGYNLHLPPGKRDRISSFKPETKSAEARKSKVRGKKPGPVGTADARKLKKVKEALHRSQKGSAKSKKTAKLLPRIKLHDKPSKKAIVVDFSDDSKSSPQPLAPRNRMEFGSEDIAVKRSPIHVELDEKNLNSSPPEADESDLDSPNEDDSERIE